MTEGPTVRHRRFRFSLRTLFVGMAAIAFGCWYGRDYFTGYPDELVTVFHNNASVTSKATSDLRARGITCSCFFAKGVYVQAARRDHERAAEIIRSASYFNPDTMSISPDFGHQYKTLGEIWDHWLLYGFKGAFRNL